MSKTRTGRVITRFGAEMIVEDEQGALRRCTARRKLAHAVCGDRVLWEPSAHGNDVVTAIVGRTNELTRPDLRGRAKAIAANIDQLVIVSAYLPQPNWEMVDRYLVAAALLPARAVIVMNKFDLASDTAVSTNALEEYRKLGYHVISTSAKSAHGTDALLLTLQGQTSILVGQSGVGKSSLVKALLPDLDVRIGAISSASGKGKHTTTGATLYHLPSGGELVDSPGVRDFELGNIEASQLAQGFVEFAPYAGDCRFHNCTHTVEPGCAVKAAVERGEIGRRRYTNYQRIMETLRPS